MEVAHRGPAAAPNSERRGQLNQILQFLQSVVTLNHSFTWDYVWKYLFFPAIIQGTILTLILSVISQFLGTLIGLLLYFVRRSNSRLLRSLAGVYILFFRGTPLLVQVLMFSFLFPYLNLARPLRNVDLFNHLGFTHGVGPIFLDLFIAAIIAFSLNEGAYMAEIVRAGIDAIDVGQLEAARSLGMTYTVAMRRIILPQAFRVIIPPLGNEFNNMLKNTSLAAAAGLTELLSTAEVIGGSLFATLELLLVASLWYLAMTSVWTTVQAAIERRLNVSTLDPALKDRGPWYRRLLGGRTSATEIGPISIHHDELGRRV
jgi:polar amino acid transport system permease protein